MEFEQCIIMAGAVIVGRLEKHCIKVLTLLTRLFAFKKSRSILNVQRLDLADGTGK